MKTILHIITALALSLACHATTFLSGAGAPGGGTGGSDGDHYLNTTDGKIWKKITGTWMNITSDVPPNGLRGPAGPRGPAGVAAPLPNIWHGSSEPASDYGSDGDVFLRENGTVYRKAEGTWSSVSTLTATIPLATILTLPESPFAPGLNFATTETENLTLTLPTTAAIGSEYYVYALPWPTKTITFKQSPTLTLHTSEAPELLRFKRLDDVDTEGAEPWETAHNYDEGDIVEGTDGFFVCIFAHESNEGVEDNHPSEDAGWEDFWERCGVWQATVLPVE